MSSFMRVTNGIRDAIGIMIGGLLLLPLAVIIKFIVSEDLRKRLEGKGL